MKFRLLVLSLSLSFPLFAQDSRDLAFLTARDAFRAGDRNKLERATAQLGNHELAPYVESYRLRMWIDQGDAGSMRAFFDRNEKSYVAEKLRVDWIRWLAKRSTWNEVEAEYARLIAPEPDVVCLNQQARLARDDKTVLDEAAKLWLTQLEPPEPCRPVIDALVIGQRMTSDDVWQRARRQIEANRPGWAKTTLNYLPDSQLPESRALDSAISNSMGYLARQPANWASSRAGRELAAIAIQRIASNDPRAAADELEKLKSRMQESEKQWAWSQIGLQAAKKHIPEAVGWFNAAGKTPLSEDAYQWKVRAALRAHDWGTVHKTIEAMPAELAAKPEWVYWLGRAHKAGGKTTEADALFEKIAGQANFYGNLADEELGRSIMPPPKATAATAEEQKAARDNPGIRRALAFFRLDMRTEAVKEWNWSLRGMNDRELLATADLAKRNQIWDRANQHGGPDQDRT